MYLWWFTQSLHSLSHNQIAYSGTNLSRLDRFYVFEKFTTTIVTIHIMSNATFSNHVPIIFSTLDQQSHGMSTLKIPKNILLDYSFLLQVVDLWYYKYAFGDSSAMNVYAKSLNSLNINLRTGLVCFINKKNNVMSLVSLQRLQECYPCCA